MRPFDDWAYDRAVFAFLAETRWQTLRAFFPVDPVYEHFLSLPERERIARLEAAVTVHKLSGSYERILQVLCSPEAVWCDPKT